MFGLCHMILVPKGCPHQNINPESQNLDKCWFYMLFFITYGASISIEMKSVKHVSIQFLLRLTKCIKMNLWLNKKVLGMWFLTRHMHYMFRKRQNAQKFHVCTKVMEPLQVSWKYGNIFLADVFMDSIACSNLVYHL